MNRVTCQYIKKDGSVCGRVCTRTTGCAKHWHLYEKNMKKTPCRICGKLTLSYTGYCAIHAKRVYFNNWYEKQKTKSVEADT